MVESHANLNVCYEKSKAAALSDFNNQLKLKGFNVFQIEADGNATRVYSRKDFYKICLTTGKSKIHYSDRSFETDGTVLFFGNPHIPYSWETLSTSYVGYTCLFSEEFLSAAERTESLQQSPLFKIGGTPILHISEQQREFLNTLFQRMIEEQKADYSFKDDLMRNYINLIIHEALKTATFRKLPPAKECRRPHYFRIPGTAGKTIPYRKCRPAAAIEDRAGLRHQPEYAC